MTTGCTAMPLLCAEKLVELAASVEAPGPGANTAVECPAATSENWCVAAGTQEVHGITPPDTFATP